MDDYIVYFIGGVGESNNQNERPFIITAENNKQALEKAEEIGEKYSLKITRIILVREDEEIHI